MTAFAWLPTTAPLRAFTPFALSPAQKARRLRMLKAAHARDIARRLQAIVSSDGWREEEELPDVGEVGGDDDA